MTTDTEWEYIELTGEQTLTLWKDVPVFAKVRSASQYVQSRYQTYGCASPDPSCTYYLKVKKESTSDNND